MLSKLFSSDTPLNESFTLPFSFNLSYETDLHIGEKYDHESSWRYLSHRVSRNYKDLRAHIQRIALILDTDSSELSEKLPGAIQDLFIALADSGNDLKEQVLDITKQQLSEDDYSLFSRLKDNSDTESLTLWKHGSVLSKGAAHTNQALVTPPAVEASSYDNIMDEVQACLEYGQIEEAQTLLQDALITNPENTEVEKELLNLYVYTRDKTSLNQMEEKLKDLGHELTDTWKDTIKESETW